ncbi:MAG: S8 family serine peptidase [candidate division Zixibacteria bacterium]|nr:S8 family serine peptidase [candidate division Zixibacteria bacterium]
MRCKPGTLAFVAVIVLAGTVNGVARDASGFVPGYQPLRPMVKPAQVNISPAAGPGHIVVKFREGITVSSGTSRLAGIGASAAVNVIARHRLPGLEPMIVDDPAAIQNRRLAAQDRIRANLPDLSLYFSTPISDPSAAAEIVRQLNALDEVEIAYFAPRPEVASFQDAMTTPNCESGQLYLNPPTDGVHARAAWTLPGGTGTGIRITDIEYGWQLTHEDLSKGASAIVINGNSTDNDHGTAVLGEMVADRNGYGMTGIAHGADIGVSSVMTQSVAGAIYSATAISQPGDLILIELHSPGPHFNYAVRDDQRGYVAMEYFPVEFDAIVNAYAQGVIVCEAAGNGAENFDDTLLYGQLFQRSYRNSHAIICGAGFPPGPGNPDRYKLGFSNYGSRVDLQGYGIQVYTTGYGDLHRAGGKNFLYNSGFSGTSSASPIVTGSVACVAGVFKNMLGQVIDADSARALLVATGSPQPLPNQIYNIGPRPNLQAALGTLFTAVDSIWYGQISLDKWSHAALPVYLSNSHPLQDIYLPFVLTGSTPMTIDSLTRGPRTAAFEDVQLIFDNKFFGEMGYVLRGNVSGNGPSLSGGSGIVAYLWVTAGFNSIPGGTVAVDTAWLGSSTRLRLVSYFRDGYPNSFSSGTITVNPCDCSHQGDINNDGITDVFDIMALIDIAFAGAPPAPTDPTCPVATRADLNCDTTIDVFDVIYAITSTFSGGPAPCNPC